MEFQLGYRQDGFGLGYTPADIQEMPMAKVAWMLKRLGEQREAERESVKKAIAEAKRGR